MNDPNNNGRSRNRDSFDFSGTSGWLGGTGYQENNEFGNNNFDDINTYDTSSIDPPSRQPEPQYQHTARPYPQNQNPYQRTERPYPQNTRPAQEPYGGSYNVETSRLPYQDEFRDPFNSRETKDLEQAVEAAHTPPPLPIPEPKKMSAPLLISFFAWVLITSGVTVLSLFSGEFWVTLPFAVQIIAGLMVFFISWPVRRSRNFGIFMIFDAVFAAAMVFLRLSFPMFTLALSKHSALHLFEAVLFFWGFYLTAGRIFTGPKKKKNCTETTTGTCFKVMTDYIPDGRGKNVSIFRPIYQYAYNGKHYESMDSNNPTLKAPKTGTVCTLLVDPDDPSDIYAVNKISAVSIFCFIFGLVLMGWSVLYFIIEMSETLSLMTH